MKGVFLDLASVDNGDLHLDSLWQTLAGWKTFPNTSDDEVAERIREADVVIANKVKLTRETLQQANSLKLICIAATGTNNVDLDAARALDIPVTNVRAYANSSVVQHVFSLILNLLRHLPEYRDAVMAGEWKKSPFFCLLDYPIGDLGGKKIGIVGYGELGKSVARVAECFGMRVLVARRDDNDRREARVPLQQLLAEVDVLSLHCPLTPQTRGLIGEAQLQQMKSTAILINTARGGVVDEHALATALNQGWIAGAGVDVLETEPPDGSSPLTARIENLILTPHIAWASQASRQRLLDQITDIIQHWLHGEMINRVNE